MRAVNVSDVVFSEQPHIRLDASITKNRKYSTVPINRKLAKELKAYIKQSSKIGASPLFPNMPEKGTKIFNRDLINAGIEKTDDKGEIVDIHSLRHTFCTRLARHGVPISIAQVLMRHSTPVLTMNVYTHLGIGDTYGAIESLPDFVAGKK